MIRKTVRAGIIGSGFAARFHCDAAWRTTKTAAEVIGVHSRTAGNAARFAEERGIAAFDNLEALLDQVDVVHVCVPPSAHEAVTVAALERGVFPIVEKPFTGAFGDGSPEFFGATAPKEPLLEEALGSVRRLLAAEAASTARICYAENWIYAPAVQKEREIVEKTGAQILWMHGEEAHSGSHSQTYGYWNLAGGGSIVGKGVHPLTGMLYLKQVEGRARNGKPIRPAAVTARTHELTRLKDFQDAGHLRTDYHDIEDFGMMHVVFEDGTVATILTSEIVMGGIHNWLEVVANNHRTVCNINPNTAMQTYNPVEANFADIYVVEKIGTKQGWSFPAPDEDSTTGFPQEIEAFYRAVAYGDAIEGNSQLAADTIATVYAAYLSAERRGTEVAITRL